MAFQTPYRPPREPAHHLSETTQRERHDWLTGYMNNAHDKRGIGSCDAPITSVNVH